MLLMDIQPPQENHQKVEINAQKHTQKGNTLVLTCLSLRVAMKDFQMSERSAAVLSLGTAGHQDMFII